MNLLSELLRVAAIAIALLASWIAAITYYRLIKPTGVWRIAAIVSALAGAVVGVAGFAPSAPSAASILWGFGFGLLFLVSYVQRSLRSFEENTQRFIESPPPAP